MDKNNPSDQLKTSKIYNPDVKYKYIINCNCFWRARIGRLKMYRLYHQHIVNINKMIIILSLWYIFDVKYFVNFIWHVGKHEIHDQIQYFQF